MVSALLNDAISDPKQAIAALQARYALHPADPDYPTHIAAHFRAIFHHNDLLKQIPPLDHMYKDGSLPLVRFRAMVQDTSVSPEIYPAVLPESNPGAWGFAEQAPAQDFSDLRQREVIWAINIPGESPFVAEHLDDHTSFSTQWPVADNRYRHKDPLMRTTHLGVQVKIYDPSLEPFKPTEVYTFVGLLALEYNSTAENTDPDSLTLTLHAIFAEKLPPTLINYIFPAVVHTFTRAELIAWIACEALDGDHDAAEWILLACIARVQSRLPPLFPPSLTLSRFPKGESNAPIALTHVLRALLPLFVDVTLTLSLINRHPFTPQSREDTLHSGLLQLPARTTVLLSDMEMAEGTIGETGVRNLQALSRTMTSQTIEYLFPFAAPYQFPTDLSFIILTEGNASPFAETQLNLPIQCTSSDKVYRYSEEICFPPADRLMAFRQHIGAAMVGDVKVTDELSEYIQSDFVRERQLVSTTKADDLMAWMTVARLLALSHQKTVLSKEIWEEAKDLDKRRRGRFTVAYGV